MTLNECAKAAGLSQVHHKYGDGSVGIYWGHWSLPENVWLFTVLAREMTESHAIIFFDKPWTLPEQQRGTRPRAKPPFPLKGGVEEEKLEGRVEEEKLDLRRAIHLHRRMDTLEKRVDIAIAGAKTSRHLLSQRYDTLLATILATKKKLQEVNAIQVIRGGDHQLLLDTIEKEEKKLHRDGHYNINRLDRLCEEVWKLQEKVRGLSQKVHDAGRSLNNPPFFRKEDCPHCR